MNAFERRLLQSAAREQWYDPHDDAQFTFEPYRLTRINGVRHVVNLGYTAYTMPDRTTPFVLYELMQRSAPRLGFEHQLVTWQRLDYLVGANEQLIKVFIEERMLPLNTCWLMQAEDGNLLLAVSAEPNKTLLRTESPLYLHVFSNDWLSEVGTGIQDPIQSHNALIADAIDAVPVITAWHDLDDGNGWLFHNGYYVNDVTMGELTAGDTLQLLRDKTGRGYFDLPLSSLKHFNSTVDARGKYLIQIPGPTAGTVETPDEIEIFICNRQDSLGAYERVKGIYYSRLHESDARMLTHRDFALDARRVEALIEYHQHEMRWDAPFIRLFLRYHTEPHKVAPELDGNYLLDLFRADRLDRESLMLGTASTFPLWRAAVLEQSRVARWQQATSRELTLDNLKGVYAFEELNRRARVTEWRDETHVLLPYAAAVGGMLQLFEDGRLVGVERIPEGNGYGQWPVPANVDAVEFLPGSFVESGDGFDRDTDYYDQADWFNERFYWRSMDDEDVWHEAVVGVDLHIDRDTGGITWDETHSSDERMRRTLRDSIYRQLSILPEMIYYPIPIYDVPPVTPLALSKLDVYINGFKLVEGIDYVVDYPHIQIYNKQYYLHNVDPNDPLKVEIFHYGVPGQPGESARWGFIRHRLLRDTDRREFAHYRHHHVTVDGRRVDVDEVNLYEAPAFETRADLREGALYALEPYPWMLGPWARMRLAHDDLSLGKEAAKSVAPFIDQPAYPEGPVFIEHAHAVYSPWLKRMLQRLREGELDLEALGDSQTAMRVAVIPYLDELEADIAGQLHDGYWPFIDIHPTPDLEQVEVTEPEFLFLRKLNTEFLHGRVVFNAYVQVDKEQIP